MCSSLVFPEIQAIRYLSNVIKHMYNGNCLEYFICASSEFPKVNGPGYPHWQTNWEFSLKHFNLTLYGYNFCFEKVIYTGNNFTFNSPPFLPTLERIMALQQMNDKKKRIFVYLVGSVQQELCPVFTHSKFFPRRLEDCPVANKV